jgi:hypothetical protein
MAKMTHRTMTCLRLDPKGTVSTPGIGHVQCETDDLSGGTKPRVVAKMQMKSKQSTATEQPQLITEAPTVQQSAGSDSDQTDIMIEVDDDPTPMKRRGALKRSFAIANLDEIDATAGAQKRNSQYEVMFSDDEDEIPTRTEKDLGHGTGMGGPASLNSESTSNSFNDDDDPTPKKKPRKVSLREAVGANRKEPEPRREQMKVCILPYRVVHKGLTLSSTSAHPARFFLDL